jgi:hypothetical protein
MNKDKRITVLIEKGFDQFIAKYIIDLVDENLKNEQKEKYKNVVLEFKFRVIYLINIHDESVEIDVNKSNFQIIDDIVDRLYQSSNYMDFDEFISKFYLDTIEEIDNYFDESEEFMKDEGLHYQNKYFNNSINFISWLLQPVRLNKDKDIFVEFMSNNDNYVTTLYFYINYQVEKEGYYKYNPYFDLKSNWKSILSQIRHYFDSIE